MTTFTDKLQARFAAGKYLCVGLDPDLSKIPDCVHGDDAGRVLDYMCAIVDATHEYAAAYKPQIAFFEALGDEGHETLRLLFDYIHVACNDVPGVLDSKRGDIGNTNRGYVSSAFDYFGADAVTIHPYLGMEANEPFLNCDDKTIFVLCRTSNDGAGEFQDVPTTPVRSKRTGQLYSTPTLGEHEGDSPADEEGAYELQPPRPLYEFVAQRVAQSWNVNDNCALVVGATYPEELGRVRDIVGSMPILLPGLGTQGGKLEKSFEVGWKSVEDVLLGNSASAVDYAYLRLRGDDAELKYTPEQYAEAAAEEARTTNDAIRALVPTA